MGRRSPGSRDRHAQSHRGTPVGSGNPSHTHKAVEVPPPLADGQVRCPVCRNGTPKTLKGHLRRHLDLFGYVCWNRRPDDADIEAEAEPVEAPRWIDGGTLSPTGYCHGEDCGRRVSGERKFCGRCLANRL